MAKKKRIIFLGDSITDAGRNYDANDGSVDQLGEGFVKIFQSGLKVMYPKKEYEVLNRGISGNRTSDLLDRLEQDVLKSNPDMLYIMIGINDVWRHFDSSYRNIAQITKKQFEQNYEEIITRCLKNNIKITLASCYFLELCQSDEMRIMVNEFNEIVKSLAGKHVLDFIDMQEKMDQFLKYNSSYALSDDRVHVNHVGAHLIADTFLNHFKGS